MRNIDAIVLAAGRSTRMKRPKARLEAVEGVSFLERAIKLLREAGCRYVIAVVNEHDDWTARLADVTGAAVVLNDVAGSQQIDSIRLGIATLPDNSEAAFILPVDVAGVRIETVRQLMEVYRGTGACVILPRKGEKTGHPVLIAKDVYGELLADAPNGAESIVLQHAHRREVDVVDAGAYFDIDTEADYEMYLRGL